MHKDPSLKSQASAIFIGNVAGTILQFLIPAVVVRLISQEDFGVYRQFGLVASTFYVMLRMGYGTSLYYFFPITDIVGKKKIIQQTQFLFIINLVILIVVFSIFGDSILIYLNFKEFINEKTFLILFISFMVMTSIIEIVFTLEKNTRLNKIYTPIQKLVRFIVLVVIILAIPGFRGPTIALVIYSFLKFLFYVYYMYPYFNKIYSINLKLLKEQLIYSIPFGFALILNLVSTTFDKFFINKYITPQEFGIYSISFLSIPILRQFFKSIHNVVVPEISIAMNNNNLKRATDLWKKTVDKTSSITIPAVFLFWTLANEIITILYTIEYIEAVKYYRVFILMFFVSMFSHELILRGANKTRYILVSNIIGTILTVIIGFVIIPKYGLYGAVFTALVGVITPISISLNFERRIMNLKVYNWVNWRNIFVNFSICFFVALPIFVFKDYITNIYLRTIISMLFFGALIIPLQMKFDLFLFNDQIFKLFKYLRLKK